MDKETLFEEIRTRLREAQEDVCTDPWLYDDEDLIEAVRSAIRHLRVLGVSLPFDMNLSGLISPSPITEIQGMLIALKVCADLLKGDLAKKLNEGSLGVSITSVLDTYSTSEGARGLQNTAKAYKMEFQELLTIVLAQATDTAASVFGQQGTSFDDE